LDSPYATPIPTSNKKSFLTACLSNFFNVIFMRPKQTYVLFLTTTPIQLKSRKAFQI
jgi:hypothetical protein